MLYDYQREELRVQATRAEHNLKSNCPLIEDEVAVAAWNHIQELEKRNNELYEFVRYIATDYVELSHDKVRWQRDDYIKMAKSILESE